MSVFFLFSHSVLFKFWVQSFCFVPCTPVPLRRARIMNSQHVLCALHIEFYPILRGMASNRQRA